MGIEIEKIDSWPHDFRRAISQNEKLILSYHLENKRIDILCEDDVLLRCYPPVNEYKTEYMQLVAELDEILRTSMMIVYHCSRLTPFEMNSIKSQGLRVLSTALFQGRIDQAFQDRWLTQSNYDLLFNSPVIQDNLKNKNGDRTSKLWFCSHNSTLRDYCGVYKFFCFWGGEVMFKGQNDLAIMATLSKIGVPCIVKCQVPLSDINSFHTSLAERFVSEFISGSIEHPHPSPSFGMTLDRDLEAGEVLDIIDINHPTFIELTRCDTWTERYNII